jgi:hypothetical protein
LVEAEPVRKRDRRLRWFVTAAGERTYDAWLDATKPGWRDQLRFARMIEAQKIEMAANGEGKPRR